jgi:AP2 domain/HNH endonuclease
MREIPLTRGQVALVDDADFEEISRHKWCAGWSDSTQSFYAKRANRTTEGKKYALLMHRHVLGLDYGDKRQGDHISGNTLDNRRENLRIASQAENKRNTRKRSTNTSGFKGVYFHKGANKWLAQIVINRKWKYLGLHPTPELAYQAYCAASAEYHGEFARTA